MTEEQIRKFREEMREIACNRKRTDAGVAAAAAGGTAAAAGTAICCSRPDRNPQKSSHPYIYSVQPPYSRLLRMCAHVAEELDVGGRTRFTSFHLPLPRGVSRLSPDPSYLSV